MRFPPALRLACACLALAGSGLAAPNAITLTGVRHEYQRLNNCGPVTIGMAMSFYGGTDTQYQIAPLLKPTRTDKNVSPDELAMVARTRGYRVHQGVAGDTGLLRRLLQASFPVIVETWFVVPKEGGMGHYRLLVGYDDRAGFFRAFDSYNGPKVRLEYRDFDRLWRAFNRTYLIVYPAKREAELRRLLGAKHTRKSMWKRALETARSEVRANPSDGIAWWSFGTSRLRLGDARGAARAFDRSRRAPPDRSLDPVRPRGARAGWPWRMLWYQFGAFEAYSRVGRHADVITLADETLSQVGDLEEALYWRGRAYAALGRTRQARADLQRALRLRPGFVAAANALKALRGSLG